MRGRRLVASADERASRAGLAVLDAGGSAVDAAIAANAVLAVVAPHLCGMGGDLFALVRRDGSPPVALNAAGPAGSGADPAGLSVMPFRADVRSVTVPGCVDGWCALHERFGIRPLEELLEPAIALAADGFRSGPLLAALAPLVADVPGAETWVREQVSVDTTIHRPGSAEALRQVARHGRDGFYIGAFGRGLVDLGAGWFAPEDLALPSARWVDPLSVEAFGHRLWTVPPPSQGYLALAGAVAAEALGPGAPHDGERIHRLAEIARHVGRGRPDELHDGADGDGLVDDAVQRAVESPPADRAHAVTTPMTEGDTTYLCVVDDRGHAVSLIQSNAADFGVHLAEPNTGIFLHNRGIGFSTDQDHPAVLAPGRRPPHTLSPLLVTAPDGGLRGVIGTMGGDSQPQLLLQLSVSWLMDGAEPGVVLSRPRFVLGDGEGRGFDLWTRESTRPALRLERHAPSDWARQLADRGHEVSRADPYSGAFGHAHLIESGGVRDHAGAADPRTVIGSCVGP